MLTCQKSIFKEPGSLFELGCSTAEKDFPLLSKVPFAVTFCHTVSALQSRLISA